MITTDPETGQIERSELVKGYEVSKGEYILLSTTVAHCSACSG